MRVLAFTFIGLVIGGCTTHPNTSTIVAPAGPATQAQTQAIDDHLAKLVKATDAATDALSKASASAGAIRTINGGQPVGPRTVGVDSEAGLIQAVAGQPKAADQLAAAERARVVAEGKADEIAKAYASAQSAALQANQELASTKTALEASNVALAKAKADAQAEQQASKAKYQAEIDRINREHEAQLKAAANKARADQRRLLTWIFFGGAAALTAVGITVIFLGASIPIFGPKAGIALLASGAGLAALGTVINVVQDFADKHPNAIWGTVVVCVAGLAVAVGLVISNHHHAMDVVKAEAQPLIDKVKAQEASMIEHAKALFGKAGS